MTNDEIVSHWTLQMDFLQSRYDFEEAQKMDFILWNWLHFSVPASPCPDYQNSKGVTTPTLLNYLNVRTATYLNPMMVQETEESLDAFERCIEEGWQYDHVLIHHFILKAELRYRQGQSKEAQEILYGILTYATNPLDLSRIYGLLGDIESSQTRYMWPLAIFKNLSKALGYAEECGDKIRIANSYARLGHAIHRQYPALALSMQWQAQVMAEKLNDPYLANATKLQRAYSDIQMLFAYNGKLKKPDLFKNDAEQIVRSLKRDDLPTEVLKTFYDETLSFVFGEDEPLERALDYYQQHGAWDKVYELAENVGGRAIFAKDDSKVLRMLNVCVDAAKRMNDPMKLDRAVKGLEMYNKTSAS